MFPELNEKAKQSKTLCNQCYEEVLMPIAGDIMQQMGIKK